MHNKSPATPTVHFAIEAYPKVAAEIAALQTSVANIRTESTPSIIISFLKNHAISTEFVTKADPVAMLIQSRSVDIKHLEDLFASSKDNKPFQRELEEYLTVQFETKHQPAR